jgi:hypothetical protein
LQVYPYVQIGLFLVAQLGVLVITIIGTCKNRMWISKWHGAIRLVWETGFTL